MNHPSCPRCGGRFQEGFILDQGDHGSRAQSAWVEGPPEKSFWTGLKLRGKIRIPVVTHRCTQCGFLESYAPKR